ncbi:hypothetical protein EII25_04585 [Erysipelotrichaceae bacterium OH741_COT-311]|nr:hypothetical protein EII25_04585 [Erysipelotrichaceae bacterium OH741_COT-311]
MPIFSKSDILNTQRLNFEESLTFDQEVFASNPRINKVEEVVVKGHAYYDDQEDVIRFDVDLSGIMLCPCAITLQELEVAFHTQASLVCSLTKARDEDELEANGDVIDLNPSIFQLLMSEVPLKVTVDNPDYPKGQGWKVVSEKEYTKEKGSEMDPRLAKLKEFKFEDKED